MSKSIRLHPKHGLNPTIPVCWLCGGEKGEVALLGAAYPEQAPMRMCLDKKPCSACTEMMKQGVLLISVQDRTDHNNPYRTGSIAVVTPEAAKKIFPTIGESRAAFIEDAAWDMVGLPRPPKEK